jgi:hypothetical protein
VAIAPSSRPSGCCAAESDYRDAGAGTGSKNARYRHTENCHAATERTDMTSAEAAEPDDQADDVLTTPATPGAEALPTTEDDAPAT